MSHEKFFSIQCCYENRNVVETRKSLRAFSILNSLYAKYIDLTSSFFEIGTMAASTKFRDPTVLGQLPHGHTLAGFAIWCPLFGDNGYPPF